MFNIRIIFFVAICFSGTLLHGQAPGYLGKRLFVEGNIGSTITLIGLSDAELDGTSNNKFINPMGRVALNWTTGRYRYIALEAGYLQDVFGAEALSNFPGQPELKYRYTLKTVSLSFYRTFRKYGRNLAPLGPFLGYRFIYAFGSSTPIRYADTNEKFEGVDRAAYNLNFKTAETRHAGLAISIGNRYILKDKITIKCQFDFAYTFQIKEKVIEDERRLVSGAQNSQLPNNILFNFSVGAGYLF